MLPISIKTQHLQSSNNFEADLKESYDYCRGLAKRNSSFYLGMLLSAKEHKQAIFAIYGWLRAVDDIVDDPFISYEFKKAKLKKFKDRTQAVLTKPQLAINYLVQEKYWLAFVDTVNHYQIPVELFFDMIRGQEQDLVKTRYETFEELVEYCYCVASTVGLMLIHIWGCSNGEKAKKSAIACGIALQLTNIMRDFRHDLALNRIYLPAEFFKVPVLDSKIYRQLTKQQLFEGINKLVKETDCYYQEANKLEQYLNRDSRLSFLLFAKTYYGVFKKIQTNPNIIFENKSSRLSVSEKIYLLANIMIRNAL